MKNPVIILGSGFLGKAAQDIFESNGVIVYGFLDDSEANHGKEINGISILGATDDDGFLKLIGKKCEAFVAVEEMMHRKGLVNLLTERRKKMPVNAVHGKAIISPKAYIGHGNYIDAGVIVNQGSEIGSHCILGSGTIIDHETNIKDFVQIGSGSIINAQVNIEEEVFIGSGVTIVSGVKIGKGARIGAGSVVVADVPEQETVFGNPAKKYNLKS
ncbi:acetyltransferase [Fulvivirgaceae bacterium BMA10]|uniref:Acetyltransferase n=1 Tax=Splendidivirga corallicola TaxID=3051826 RepID=A0ABT8KIS2_9BACT|nr:acetyltransferase [Fulvivirgaceae bacterium BMA10]